MTENKGQYKACFYIIDSPGEVSLILLQWAAFTMMIHPFFVRMSAPIGPPIVCPHTEGFAYTENNELV